MLRTPTAKTQWGMATAFFMGVQCSFGGETTNSDGNCSASAFFDALNHVLAENGLDPYHDPEKQPRVYRGHLFGRSALDHHSPRVLAEIATMAEAQGPSPNLALIRENPHRAIFLPRALPRPLATGYCEINDGAPVTVWAGSLPQLLQELVRLAHTLRIPVIHGRVSDQTAFAINMFRPFHERDSTKVIESYRTAWLALYEGARLAMENCTALTLVG